MISSSPGIYNRTKPEFLVFGSEPVKSSVQFGMVLKTIRFGF